MSTPARNPQYEAARAELDDYERGWLDCLYLYAHWRDGTMYVGSTGRTYNHAARNFLLRERGKRLEVVDALYPLRTSS